MDPRSSVEKQQQRSIVVDLAAREKELSVVRRTNYQKTLPHGSNEVFICLEHAGVQSASQT